MTKKLSDKELEDYEQYLKTLKEFQLDKIENRRIIIASIMAFRNWRNEMVDCSKCKGCYSYTPQPQIEPATLVYNCEFCIKGKVPRYKLYEVEE